MAGKFVTILNPGYSTLYTRDLPFAVNSNVEGSGSPNVFNPDDSNPLQEGEWLTPNNDLKLQRGIAASGSVTAAGGATSITMVDTADNKPANRPCFMYFQERGRYDAQLTRKAHAIVGPSNYEFRTKMIDCAADDHGERVFVYVCEDSSGRLVSALVSESAADAHATPASRPTTGSWYAGYILQCHGANDATVIFQPGSHE